MQKARFLFPALLLCYHVSASRVHAQAFFEILSLKLDAARDAIAAMPMEGEAGLRKLRLENYQQFTGALISGSRGHYQDYLRGEDRRIRKLRQQRRKYPDSRIYLSELYLQSSILHRYHGEPVKSFQSFYHARRQWIQAVQARDDPAGPAQAETGLLPGLQLQKLQGILEWMAGSAPREYRWILRLTGMDAERTRGVELLEAYHQSLSALSSQRAGSTDPNNAPDGRPQDRSSSFLRPERMEASLLLLLAGGRVAETEDLDSLTLYRYARAWVAWQAHDSDAVLEWIGHWKQSPEERTFPFMHLLRGEALLTRLEPAAADPFMMFLDVYQGEHYRSLAWHKLSWHHLLQGDLQAYRHCRNKVSESGGNILEADLQARAEAADTLLVNPLLLQARLLSDGGYLDTAIKLLLENGTPALFHIRDSVEYDYRLGRIHEESDREAAGVSCYRKVLDRKDAGDWYFAPNAALRLGMIHEREGRMEQALSLYEISKKINRSAYQNSMNARAQEGIQRIRAGL